MTTGRRPPSDSGRTSGVDPLWFKDAIIYEVHVRAFRDANGDGVGDVRGLIEKLEYLRDLGVTTLWLLPFYPSPLKDDGYDIASYKDIHPAYGNLRDFKVFMREARRQGLQVITELVLNHTSDQHPWFQRARRARIGTSARDFYVWSDTPDRYSEARIIFKDFETSNWSWDQTAGAYFWHRFYSHMPDLNYDNPDVKGAMFDVVDFWLELGVDGLRLDAVPYLFEREGTNCENLPETFAFLEELRAHVDERFPGRMLLAEANQWPEDAVAYFGTGNRSHMAFHFPLMPRMFMATRMEDRYPVVDILIQTPPIPETCQWAIFLRNHDELTLEMVTDEERDYMYRVYARDPQARLNLGIRRRLAPLLGNDRRLIEMMNLLLFTLPGTPVIYYGDELGMGDNIYLGDRNGVRTPMQWSPDRNAGFSKANPQRLYLPVIIDPEYHYEALNVESQQNNQHSLLWWMKRLIALRKRYAALGRGTIEFLYPENRKVLAFVRRYRDERILVVANLSRFAQYVELDLSAFQGMVPVELFGRTDFPRVEDRPYLLTLGPYAYTTLSLEHPRTYETLAAEAPLPVLEVAGGWTEMFGERGRAGLEDLLPTYLRSRRWFRAKSRRIKTAEIVDAIPIAEARDQTRVLGQIVLVHVEFTEGDPHTYVLALAFAPSMTEPAPADRPEPAKEVPRRASLARVITANGEGVLFDALHDPAFARALLDHTMLRRRIKGRAGRLEATPTKAFGRGLTEGRSGLDPAVLQGEQSNTSVVYGETFLLKVFRRLEEGQNPDLEVGRFLTERAGFPNIPPVAGSIEYRSGRSDPMTLAILEGYVPNEGDAWRYTLDRLSAYLDAVLARQPESNEPPPSTDMSLLDLSEWEPPGLAFDMFGHDLESARLLGRRTAELHLALASDPNDPAFAPEPLTVLYQRSLYQSMRGLTQQVFRLLRTKTHDVPQVVQVLDLEEQILARFRMLVDTRVRATRIRCHGDYHLGQVLYTGRDFVIIDFEGEPLRPLSERRIKRSPLFDVAGMIRSFHYAAYTSLFEPDNPTTLENPSFLEPWLLFWYRWVSAAFLRTYLQVVGSGSLLPESRQEREVLLSSLLLEKALYELRYELNMRPGWVRIPIAGVLQLLETGT
jgi:maltose alpha-D-glucosyltransferase/alpha-amylase